MRTFTMLFSALVLGTTANAQTVATFEDQALTTDTCYINYSAPGTDVGFNDGLAHFPCVYDTSSFGDSWGYGFAYSNKTDSVTSGLANQYSAKAGTGYGGSAKYAVAWVSNPVTFAPNINLPLIGAAIGKPVTGFYITNNTYACNSMRDGDAFGKKFGGTTGNDPDWFKLTVRGYLGGSLKPDSVGFYLADYRFAHNDSDYIVRDWQWLGLASLGDVDSLQFSLSSSDNGSFGMNTPAYFCMDNFTTNQTGTAVAETGAAPIAKVYPNPAASTLNVDMTDNSVRKVVLMDATGSVINVFNSFSTHLEINIAALPAGIYVLQLCGDGKTGYTKFVKK